MNNTIGQGRYTVAEKIIALFGIIRRGFCH